MKRILLALLFILGSATYSRAQFTVATATPVKDPSGSPYVNCHGNGAFVPSPSATQVPLLSGSTFQTDVSVSQCDSFGNMTITLADNNAITDGHAGSDVSQWRLNISSQDGKTNFSCTLVITGATQDVTAALQACAAPLPPTGGGGGTFVVKSVPCASTMVFTMAGVAPNTSNTAFNVNLNCNVASTSVVQAGGGSIQLGAVAQFTLTEPNVAGFSFAWPSNFIDQPTIQQGSNQTTNASFWYDGTNWHAQTFPATGSGGGAVNAAIKPTLPGDPIQFVSTNGNDANDGLSWGTAKLTVRGACIQLPGGATSPATCGAGTIYFTSGAAAHPTATCGLWLMAGTDPNYGSPPTCWMRFSGPLSIIGVGSSNDGPNAHSGGRAVLVGGGNADRNHPGIWLSGTQGPIYFENVSIKFPARGVLIGECSTNTRANTCSVSGATFRNSTVNLNAVVGNGPAWDITGASFWIWLEHCGASGLGGIQADTLDKSAAILIDGQGNFGNGFIFIKDSNVASGGIKFWAGSNGGDLTVSNLSIESITVAPVWFASQPSQADIDGVYAADSSNVAAVQNDGFGLADAIVARNLFASSGGIPQAIGPVTTFGFPGQTNRHTIISPTRYQQQGWLGGRVIGQHDSARRSFSPQAVRFSNLANAVPVTDSGSGTVTTGITALDGTTGAVTVTASSGVYGAHFYRATITPVLNEWLIAGTWVRATTGGGLFSQNIPAALSLTGTNTLTGKTQCTTPWAGDGDWQWCWIASKVTATSSNGELIFNAIVDTATPASFYGPVLFRAAAGSISDNEAWETALNLASYPATASVGDVAMMPGQRFSMSTPTSNFFIKHIGTPTADRNVTWPDTSFTVPATSLVQTWTANQSFSNGTQLRFFSPNGTNFTSIQGPSSNGVNVNLVLPNANSTGVQCFNNDGAGNISYSNCSGGTGTPGGANTQVQFNSTGTFGGSPNLTWVSPMLTVGLNATVTGQIGYAGLTSGKVTTQSQDVAGTWTFKWPATAGTAGFPMITDGTGVASWSLLGLAGGGTNSGAGAFTNNQLVGVSAGALASLAGTLTGANPVLKLTSGAIGNVPFALDTPASPTADIFDVNINAVKTAWIDNLGIWHAPSYTATGAGALALSGTESTCPTPAGGIDILCIGNLATHTIQSSLNGAAYKDNAQFSNSGPAAHGVCLVGAIFPQLNCTSAGLSGQAFVSGGAGADGFYGVLGVVGGGTGNATNTLHGVGMGQGTAALNFSAAGTTGQPFLSGGAGADGAYAALNLAGGSTIVTGILPLANVNANIVTVTGAITPNDCVKWSSSTVITDSGGTCGGAGGSARLDQLLGGTATNTINSTIFPQVWNWALTGSTTAMKFGENTAATGSNNILFQISTLNTSTATPFRADSNGNGVILNSSGLFTKVGTGAIDATVLSGIVPCANQPAETGDVTNSAGSCAMTIAANAVTAAKSAVVLTRRECDIAVGDTSGAAITNAQLGPQKRVCKIPFAATVVEIDVSSDAGTPNVIVGRSRCTTFTANVCTAETRVNLTSAALAAATGGFDGCSNTGGTTGLDGGTTCSATLQNTGLNIGDYLELVSGTAGGTAKLMTIHVIYTVN